MNILYIVVKSVQVVLLYLHPRVIMYGAMVITAFTKQVFENNKTQSEN